MVLPADFVLEDKREDLRDRRWQRRRDKVRTATWVILACCAAVGLPQVVWISTRLL
jgi:hypothetical protein